MVNKDRREFLRKGLKGIASLALGGTAISGCATKSKIPRSENFKFKSYDIEVKRDDNSNTKCVIRGSLNGETVYKIDSENCEDVNKVNYNGAVCGEECDDSIMDIARTIMNEVIDKGSELYKNSLRKLIE